MNKVLIVTYYWPPGAGAGVQRWLKFAKYLPQHNREPVILTVDPGYAAYPFTDHSLENEIIPDLKVYKTPASDFFKIYTSDRSRIPSAGFATGADDTLRAKLSRFIRGNIFIPDPRRGWNRFAFRKACEIIENEKIDHIITTSPPHSTQLIGLRLKKKYPAIRWIADLRDPWTDIYYYDKFYPTWISRKIDTCYEKQVLQNADKIITVGRSLKELFASKIPGAEQRIEVIHNGYDDEDFTGLTSVNPELFTVSYIGTLSDLYPVKGLLDALKTVAESGKDFRLRFIGSVSEKKKEEILSSAGISRTEFIPYVTHHEAIKFMLESTLLLLIIPDHPGNKCIITGKLFEYLASGKPVLSIGPEDGDAAYHLKKCGQTGFFRRDDDGGMVDYIMKVMDSGKHLTLLEHPEYSRRMLTQELAGLLELLLHSDKL